MSFIGAPKCMGCGKNVYPMERMDADGKTFHKTCMRCAHCQCTLKLGNFAAMQGQYYCKPHFKQLFKLKGNYDSGFGREPAKMRWDAKQGLGYGSDDITADVTAGGHTQEEPVILPSAKPEPPPPTGGFGRSKSMRAPRSKPVDNETPVLVAPNRVSKVTSPARPTAPKQEDGAGGENQSSERLPISQRINLFDSTSHESSPVTSPPPRAASNTRPAVVSYAEETDEDEPKAKGVLFAEEEPQRDQVERQKVLAEKQEIERIKNQIAEERKRLGEEKKKLEDERKALEEEKNRVREQVKRKMDELEQQKQKLASEQSKLAEDRNALQRDREAVEREKASVEASKRKQQEAAAANDLFSDAARAASAEDTAAKLKLDEDRKNFEAEKQKAYEDLRRQRKLIEEEREGLEKGVKVLFHQLGEKINELEQTIESVSAL